MRRLLIAMTCLALTGGAVPVAAQETTCAAGSFETLYRQSDARLREFLQGMWQSEGPDTVGNLRRSTYSFHVNGTFTRDETVCFSASNTCHPTQGQGYFATYSAQQGVLSLAMYENNQNCAVSHLVIQDRNTLYGARDPSRRPLRRIQ